MRQNLDAMRLVADEQFRELKEKCQDRATYARVLASWARDFEQTYEESQQRLVTNRLPSGTSATEFALFIEAAREAQAEYVRSAEAHFKARWGVTVVSELEGPLARVLKWLLLALLFGGAGVALIGALVR